MQRFSTLTLAPQARRRYWEDVVAQTFPGMSIDAGDGIRADMSAWSLGAAELACVQSERARVHRTTPDSAERLLVFHLQRRGRSMLTQGSREATACRGAIVVADAAEPYEIDISDRNECLVLTLPVSALGPEADAADWRGRAIGEREAGAVLLFRTVEALWEARALGDELDPLCFDALVVAVRAALRRRVCDEIEADARNPIAFALRHLEDPWLTTDVIADGVGLTPRGVQKAFLREVGRTPSDFIAERRLARAADLLRRSDGRSVTDIAFAVGFADSSQFSRRFRRRYETSPSEWRRAAG